MNFMLSPLRTLFALIFLLILAACADVRSKSDQLTGTLKAYGVAVRWGDATEALKFVDPEVLKTRPMSRLELDRFAQLEVAGYREQGDVVLDQFNIARQIIVIEYVNKHTQTPRTVIDRQEWRYDAALKRWLLTSGLPDLNQTQE
jgi:hypothetical protein